MSAVRARDNKAEVILRRAVWRKGFRYRLYSPKLPGRPDLTFPRFHVVVFVDGDFWHGRGIVQDGVTAFRRTLRTKRREWWVSKIRANVARDLKVTRLLRGLGWKVVRLWESEVVRNPERAVRTIEAALRPRRSGLRGRQT